jgi:hypothetical protein
LNQHPAFAIWQRGRGHWLTGLTDWPQRSLPPATRNHPQVAALLDDPVAFANQYQLTTELNATGLAQTLTLIFSQVSQPVELDDLVSLVAALCGIKDQFHPTEAAPADQTSWLEQLPDPRPDLSDTLAQRSYLARLWQEVCQMSPRHCAALLLNLRDERGGSATELLVYTGIATFAQLAAALALSEPELAELWPRMPLDDLMIAERLGLTRQQVINLRRSARERLWRRLHDLK